MEVILWILDLIVGEAILLYFCTRKEVNVPNGKIFSSSMDKQEEIQLSSTVIPFRMRHIFLAGSIFIVLVKGILFTDYWIDSPSSRNNLRGLIPKDPMGELTEKYSGEYHALLIGNENYKHLKTLSKPAQDVASMREILTNQFGFDSSHILTKLDASRDDMYDGLEEIANRVNTNDNLLIFYAGHGQADDNEGYWIPIDGHNNSKRDWISNLEVKRFLASMKARKILVVSDACFSGSILREIDPEIKGNRISKKRSRIALTSGSVETVPDKSIFIEELFSYLKEAQDPIVYVADIFSNIREGVLSNTSNDPGYGPIRDTGHQGGDFFFIRAGNK